MKYDLIITKISNSVSKQIIARHLASDPSISHNDALMLLDNLPFLYLKKISEEKMRITKSQLERLGVFCIIRESSKPHSEDTVGEKNVAENMNTTLNSQEGKKSFNNLKSKDVKKITFNSKNASKNSENRNRKKIKFIVFIILALIFTIVIIIGTDANRTFTYKSQKFNISDNNKKKIKSGTSRVEPSEVKKSKTYLDSARQMGNRVSKAIKFYKIALSFNRYNLVAWQGLLKAYQEANMWPEVQETKKQIEDIFGNSVFTIEKIIEPYGELTEISSSEDGFCRIGYVSKSLKKRKIEMETYLILQAVFTRKDCQRITLYASTGKGTGLLVNISEEIFPLKISDYRKKASITFVK